MFEKVALNILFSLIIKEEIKQVYISKHNSEPKNTVILFMNTECEKQHYLHVKSVYKFLRRIISKQDGESYCIQCLLPFRRESKLKSHACVCVYVRVCRNHDYCHLKIPEAHSNILRQNQDQTFMKIPFIVYADTELLLV